MFEKLSKIRHEIGVLNKNNRNEFQKFSYFNTDQVINKLNPLLQKYKLFYYYEIIEEKEHSFLFQLTFQDLEADTNKLFKYWVSKDTQIGNKVQGFGATTTYAHRYCLGLLFGFVTEVDPDSQDNTKKPAEAKITLNSIKKLGRENIEKAKELNVKFNIKSVNELKENQYADYYNQLKELI